MRSELLSDSVLSGAPVIEGFKVLDPVVLYEKLGEGGMGAVYRGHHLKLDIPVALKCLKPAIAGENPDLVARFGREATVAASLDSENLVRVFDVHHFGDLHYLLMEYVPGETIRQRIERLGPLDPDLAASVIYEAARGLVPAHEVGIVHRDIKPDNVIIASSGRIKVTDLGLAKVADGPESFRTRSGVIMGTPSFMPPEQYRDASDLGPPADVYALGLTLFYALTGRAAVRSGSIVEVMRRVCEEPLPDLDEILPDLPAGLATAFRLATKKDPDERPRNAMEFMSLIGPYRRRRGARAALGSSSSRDEDASATRRAVLEATAPQRETIRLRLREGVGAGTRDKTGGTVPPTMAGPPDSLVEGESVPATWAPSPSGESPSTESASASGSRLRLVMGGAVLGVLIFLAMGAASRFGLFGDDSTDQRERFERGVADLRGASTLDRGVDSLLALREDAPEYPGLDEELRPALGILARRHADENGLGRAWRLIESARALGAGPEIEDLATEVRDAIRGRLESALVVEEPKGDTETLVSEPAVEVSGRVDIDQLRDLGIDEVTLRLSRDDVRLVGGAFRHGFTLNEGRQDLALTLRAFDRIESVRRLPLVLDRTDPVLTLDPRPEGRFVKRARVQVSGTVTDASTCRILLFRGEDQENAVRARFSADPPADDLRRAWAADLTLEDGEHTIVVEATDAVGRRGRLETKITVDLVDPILRAASIPDFVEAPTFELKGTLFESHPDRVEIVGPSPTKIEDSSEAKARRLDINEAGPFSVALKLEPGANHFLLRARDEAGRRSRLRFVLRRETVDTWAAQGAAKLGTGRFAEASRFLARARAADATARPARWLDHRLAMSSGALDRGREACQRALAQDGELAELINDRAVGNWLAEIRGASVGENPRSRRLLAEFERATRLNDKSLAARANLGIMKMLNGEAEEAERLLRSAVDARPRDAGLRHALGWVQQVRGRPLEAVVHYDRAVEIDPGHLATRLNRGEALLVLKRQAPAFKDLTFALTELQKKPASGSDRSVPVKLGGGVGDEAALVLTPTVKPTRSLADLLASAALARHRRGDHLGAIRDWDRAATLTKDQLLSRVEALVAGGRAADEDRAILEVGRLLKRKDLTSNEKSRLRVLRAAAGLEAVFRRPGTTKAKDARTRLERANLDAVHPGLLLVRCNAKLLAKDWKGAEADATSALKREPNNARAYFLRGTARSWLKDWKGYLSDSKLAYGLNPKLDPGLAKRLDGWYVAMRRPSAPRPQSYILPSAWPAPKDPQDQANLKQGKAISHLSKGRSYWFVVHEKPKGRFRQAIQVTKTFPREWVTKRWEERYQIRAVEWTGTKVVTVMRQTQATDSWVQSYTIASKSPDEWMKQKAKENYRLIMIAQVSATERIYIMDRPLGHLHPGQSWRSSTQLPRSFFADKAREGYRPQTMLHDGRSWHTVATKVKSEASHRFFGGTEFPREEIVKAWNEGYRIVATDYGPDVPAPSPSSKSPYDYFDKKRWNEAERALQARTSPSAGKEMPYLLLRRRLIDIARGRNLDEIRRRALLDRAWSAPQQDGWSRTLLSFVAGDIDEAGLLQKAGTDRNHLCEANYYAAWLRKARGDRAGYLRRLRACVAQKVTNFTEYRSARIELGLK